MPSTTALPQHKTEYSNVKKDKHILWFAGTYNAKIYSGDWVEHSSWVSPKIHSFRYLCAPSSNEDPVYSASSPGYWSYWNTSQLSRLWLTAQTMKPLSKSLRYFPLAMLISNQLGLLSIFIHATYDRMLVAQLYHAVHLWGSIWIWCISTHSFVPHLYIFMELWLC